MPVPSPPPRSPGTPRPTKFTGYEVVPLSWHARPSPFASRTQSQRHNLSGSEDFTVIHKELDVSSLERGRSLRKHRKRGTVPYPLNYSHQLRDFDSLDHALMLGLTHNKLIMQDNLPPPKRVLDIGCGGGLWIMELASRWPEATFVGLDIAKCQPDLYAIMREDIASRIQWVHANFLDPLPFEDGEFDFVGIKGIAMGVPEDEWPSLIQEVARVLKPGGSLEIMEEDILLPCPETPFQHRDRTNRVASPPRSQPYQRTSSTTARKHALLVSSAKGSAGVGGIGNTYGRRETDDSDTDGSEDTVLDTLRDFFDLESDKSDEDPDADGTQDQRDHSRLKETFNSLLSRRFINPRVLTILPFYLDTAFQDVHCYPALQLFLPPPSGVSLPESSFTTSNLNLNSNLFAHISTSTPSTSGDAPEKETDDASTSTKSSTQSSHSSSSTSNSSADSSLGTDPTLPSLISITPATPFSRTTYLSHRIRSAFEVASLTHVRLSIMRAIALVRGCKEAMFEEYEKLYKRERPVPNQRMDRDDFEGLVFNWECDMQDRAQMRSSILSNLSWPLPPSLSKPACQEWREKGDLEGVESFYAGANLNKENPKMEPLRSMRGFVCRNPA